jgi:hypothetical protein
MLRRYCHLKDIYVDANGKAVAEEQIREVCLWNVLTENNTKTSSHKWWAYKAQYLEQCTTEKKTYGEQCSEECVKALKLSSDQVDAWRQCWEPYKDANNQGIQVVENQIGEMGEEKEEWYNKLAIAMNDVHYHGLFDKVRSAARRGVGCSFCGAERDGVRSAARRGTGLPRVRTGACYSSGLSICFCAWLVY